LLAPHRETGQPAILTLRQLRCQDEALSAGLVRSCENPVVIAAAMARHTVRIEEELSLDTMLEDLA
jgi:hypothetical protein